MNKLLLISLLVSFASFSVNSSDSEELGDWQKVDCESTGTSSDDYSPETFVSENLNANNAERNAWSGTIKLGEREFSVKLYNRRDLASQTLSNLGGQPSHYSMTEILGYKNGLLQKGDTYRGRLQTGNDETQNAYKMVFGKWVVNAHDYERELTPESVLYTIYIPFNKISQVDKNYRAKISLTISRTMSDRPLVNEASFFSTDGTGEITLDLECEDSYLITELGTTVINVAGSTVGYISGALSWGWGCLTRQGALKTATQVIQLVDTVNRVGDGVSSASEALQNGTLLDAARDVVKNSKKVEEFVDDVAALTNLADKAVHIPTVVNLEAEQALANKAVLQAQADFDGAEQRCLDLTTQIALFRNKGKKFQAKVPVLNEALEQAQNQKEIKETALTIAQLKLKILSASSDEQKKMTAEIKAQEEFLAILTAPDEE